MYLPAPPPAPLRPMHGMGVVSFALGLMVTFGLIVYATWMAVAAVTAVSATRHGESAGQHGAVTSPPVAALPVVPTPPGSTMGFGELWSTSDGNAIVAGAPSRGTSAQEGQSVIRVAVTLINNGERVWNPASTTFIGTLNGAPAPEATEGDWMYSAPIVGHTSVTLTKVFVGGPGQFNLTVNTPNGVALFTGQV
ncbi:MAG: hypothetical protein M3186_13370 [Actinomycetota bacterium]|nr:hypothetical protein [Actinomycetota bacterium]